MNNWKSVFYKLSDYDAIFAKWHIRDRSYFYMNMPGISDLNEEGVQVELSLFYNYEIIEKIEIPSIFEHGNLKIKNNINEIKKMLNDVGELHLSESAEGLILTF